MDTMSAFELGVANRGKPMRVFDWNRAAELIRDRRPASAGAGLSNDWEWTGGRIYEAGAPVPQDQTYIYLASTWAAPQLDLDGEIIECWRWQGETPGWDSHTYWPQSALDILETKEKKS